MREGSATGAYPRARSDDLIVEELGDEFLVYDQKTDRGHCLSSTAARVWRRCDGHTRPEDLSAELDLDRNAVAHALSELEACELLERAPELTVVPARGNGATRREVATKFVKAGAVAAAAPLIVSVAAPTPAQAQTINFCMQFNSDMGCGTCQMAMCCCCTPAGGAGKLCVTADAAGMAICCAQFGAGTVFAAGCPGGGCPGAAETESQEFQTQSQDSAVTEPAPTEPAPTEPAPTEPAPTEPAPTEPAPTEPAPTEPAPTEPAPTEPAAPPTTEAPATGGSATPPTTEATTP
jgi:hypothetical protein